MSEVEKRLGQLGDTIRPFGERAVANALEQGKERIGTDLHIPESNMEGEVTHLKIFGNVTHLTITGRVVHLHIGKEQTPL